MSYEVIIIGLGGIGSVLANTISRYINSMTINPAVTINLVDGDIYENKNLSRQEFDGFGNKADMKCMELKNKFRFINYRSIPEFVNLDNIKNIIKENLIVFVCVDNHKTRKLISDYCGQLQNIIVISGGNELIDGNVQIFIRKEGQNLTPSLTDYHPEINTPLDKSPDEMSCEELSKSEPQLYFTNFMVAAHMCSAFYNIIEQRNYSISEVYFDLLTMNANSKRRAPQTTKREEKEI